MKRRNIPDYERGAIIAGWDSKCAYCEKKDGPFEIEHIVPFSTGGTCEVENFTIACFSCNRRKHATQLPIFYEGLLLAVAGRRAGAIRKDIAVRKKDKILQNYNGRGYCEEDKIYACVFGFDYVDKYLKPKPSLDNPVNGNLHRVTKIEGIPRKYARLVEVSVAAEIANLEAKLSYEKQKLRFKVYENEYAYLKLKRDNFKLSGEKNPSIKGLLSFWGEKFCRVLAQTYPDQTGETI